MKVGDLLRDASNKDIVVVTAINPTWYDSSNGIFHSWDFEVMSNNVFYYADWDDLEFIE